MYFYGATQSGWDEIRTHAKQWLRARNKRTIEAYIGTDHALTEPEALTAMKQDGVAVFLLTCYSGIFHPKLIVFSSNKYKLLLSGSNNLTRSGLSSNIEFATAVKIPAGAERFVNWESAIHNSSNALSKTLLKDYEQQRNQRLKKLQKSNVPWQFTWRKRRKAAVRKGASIQPKLPIKLEEGTLLYEVMPKETGPMGSQIQILKQVAIGYFGLPNRVGSSVSISLTNVTTGEERCLTMTYNSNTTMRLSIHEASYTERPCFLLFQPKRKKSFDFAVISEALDPMQFQFLDNILGGRRQRKRRTLIF
ncbi:hypothetical protein DB345_00230 [Spartobacteria bacterium LR76]|nr:hypothetical protein DB345_00230 [Spartobacteria bacterium LR76]